MEIKDVYSSFYQKVYNFFKSRVKADIIAQDLTQDVFVKLIKANYQEIHVSVSALVFKIAKNTLIDFYRSAKDTTEFSEESFLENEQEVWDGEFESDVQECILVMLDKIPKQERLLLERIDINNESQKEISKELGLTYSALKSKIQRSRKKLHKELVNCCEFSKDKRGTTSFCRPKGH
jgi:RNA polymerase sigma-70 factor (ECF subfamily)